MSSKKKKIKDQNCLIISNSEYFDEDWYASKYELEDFDAAYHYLYIGFNKGYNPGPDFSTINYYICNPDVEKANMNPLLHYELYGRDGNRQLELSEDEKEKRRNAILNSEYFDEDWYYSNYEFDEFDAVDHYLYIGFKKGFNPGPEFSTSEYYEANPSVKGALMNPLLHYELYGRKENRKIRIVITPYVSVNDELSKYYLLESNKEKIVLIGHNANLGGAEILLKNIITELRKNEIEVAVLVKNDGPLIETYKEMAPTFIIENEEKAEYYVSELTKYGYKSAISNTVVTGDLIPILQKYNFYTINLIHELPYVIKILKAEDKVKLIAENSDLTVFPSTFVAEKFEGFYKIQEKKLIEPQGLYNVYDNFDDESKQKIIEKYDIPVDNHIILNVGLGEYRKGFDLFFEIAKKLKDDKYTFIWVGSINNEMESKYLEEINQQDNIICTGFIDDKDEMMRFYYACDVFMLTSREDPFPSVVLEAFNAKKPVIGFEDAGGFRDIVLNDETGYLVDYESVDGLIEKIQLLCNDPSLKDKLGNNAKELCKKYNFSDYIDTLKTYCIHGQEEKYTELVDSNISLENILNNKNNEIDSLKNTIELNHSKISNLKIKNKQLNENVNNEIIKLKQKNKKLRKKNKKLTKQNNEILFSASWKITSPLRKIKHGFKKNSKNNKEESSQKISNKKSKKKSTKKRIPKSFKKIDLSLKDKTYSKVYSYPYNFKTYICDDEKRVNLFIDHINESVYELHQLFVFLSDYCSNYDYGLRIIYNNADFEIFNDFISKSNLELPDQVSFLNLKNENYLDISLDDKFVCTSWQNAIRLLNSSSITSMIYVYLDNLSEYSQKDLFQISNVCFNKQVAILNDNLSKLKELKKFRINYKSNIIKKFSKGKKTLCCEFGELYIEGMELLNKIFFSGNIEKNNWDIYFDPKNNDILDKNPKKLENFDLIFKFNYNQSIETTDVNFIEFFIEELNDNDNCNIININNYEELKHFDSIVPLKAYESDDIIEEICNIINGSN